MRFDSQVVDGRCFQLFLFCVVHLLCSGNTLGPYAGLLSVLFFYKGGCFQWKHEMKESELCDAARTSMNDE